MEIRRRWVRFLVCAQLLHLSLVVRGEVVESDEVLTSPNVDSGSSGFTDLISGSEVDPPRPYCLTGNPVDDCWRCDPAWHEHRQRLAECAVGFGSRAAGGRGGDLYVVTTSDDDLKSPAPGTLRYGATRPRPLWIVFASSMTIRLKGELLVARDKTIDGRGAAVHLVGSSQVSVEGVANVIIHGIYVHDIVAVRPAPGPNTLSDHAAAPGQLRAKTVGDAVHIEGSRDVWIDHCFFARAADGLVDGTKNSTAITVSNCYFENHDKVMLFGAHPDHEFDKEMQITVAFNRFGPGLVQRMPRCRYGNCHVANNYYTDGWGKYAIGGSCGPTILSEGNIFVAAKDHKEVTSRINEDSCTSNGDWISSGDVFQNDAYFVSSGEQDASALAYKRARSFIASAAALVPAMTKDAGPLNCVPGTPCSGNRQEEHTSFPFSS